MMVEDTLRMQIVQERVEPVCGRNEEYAALLGGCICPFNCTWCYWYEKPIREENK